MSDLKTIASDKAARKIDTAIDACDILTVKGRDKEVDAILWLISERSRLLSKIALLEQRA